MGNFGLKEDFDVDFKPSIDVEHLEFKGICQVIHVRQGEVLSVDTGSNVITNTGKVELVKLMGAVDGESFNYIALGRGGATQASANDKMLGGSLSDAKDNTNLVQAGDANGAPTDGYYVSNDGLYGFEYNKNFIQGRHSDPTQGTDTSPRHVLHSKLDQSSLDFPNFYHETSETTFTGDTLLWHQKSVFKGIGAGLEYTPDSVTINEAGIFNRDHAYSTPTGGANLLMPVMLARRTFSDKPVKISDELTIRWQITIK